MPKMPGHGWKECVKALEKFGFKFERFTRDRHRAYSKPGQARPVIVPMYDDLPRFIIKNIIKTANISRDDYIAALTEKDS